MIGLGSNRLTVCRRGGMSVTQAGRGGMEWLAGGRGPSWASPYSAQATAALKAQFPTQWPTIRDYGFAHPEIVGYMNAYAPEDAKIAYSLVEGIGTRFVCNPTRESGNTAYIDLQVSIDHSKKIEIESITEYGYGASVFGVRYYNNDSRLYIINDTFSYGANNVAAGATGILKFNIVVNNRTSSWTVNGIQGTPQTSTFSYTNKSPYLLGIRTPQDTLQSGYNNRQGTFKLKNGSINIWLVPFKRNGVMEMLNLISGQLADRHGTFTELIASPS